MSTTPPTQTLRSLYRSLLRELPQRPLSSPSPLKQYMRTHIGAASQSADSTNAATQSSTKASAHPLQLAQLEQFIQYARAQRVYTTLLERYNPGMSMDEEQRVRLTMRRVGMDAPDEWRGNGE